MGIEPGLGKFLVLDAAAVKPVVRLGQLVDQYLVHAQRAAHVTQGAARPVTDHRGGEGGALAAVAGVDVLDDFLTPLVLKVDVDVGRLVARAADEALKQQAGMRRVDLGHAQAIAHRRIGGRAPALAKNAFTPGKAHDVVHRQKIHLVAQLGNQRQLVRHLLRDTRRQTLRVTPRCAFVGVLVQGLAWAQAGQHALHRVLVAQLVQVELATCCHHQGVGQQLGRVQPRQPLAGAQVRLGIGLQGKTTVGHRPAQADSSQHIVQRLARTHMHLHPAGGHQRQPAQAGHALQRLLPKRISRALSQRQAQPQSGAKQGASPCAEGIECFKLHSKGRQQQQLAGGQRASGQIVPTHLVTTLGRGATGLGNGLAQVAPTVQVVRQGHQGAAVRQGKFGAGQQLQAALFGLGMRPHQPGHRTRVGDGQCVVAQLGGARHQLLGVRGTALEAEVGQAMQLGIAGGGGHST